MQREQNGALSNITYPFLPIGLTIRVFPRDVGRDCSKRETIEGQKLAPKKRPTVGE